MKSVEMEVQILSFVKSLLPKIIGFFTSIPQKITGLMTFLGTLGLTTIAPLIHLTLIFVFVDMLFGLAVTIYKKGWSHILSCRLRDSLVKAFFYLLIIIGLFAIETVLIDGYALTAKLAFSIIAGTELWSIMANMLILFPNLPALKLLKKYLGNEIAKKLSITNDETDKCLEDGEK